MLVVRQFPHGRKDFQKFWMGMLQGMCGIWMRQGVSGVHLPEKGFGGKGQECKGGKKSKHRATNAAGESDSQHISRMQ